MIRVKKREGHYTIKIVDALPKHGNSNWLYAIRSKTGSTTITVLYEWNPFVKEFEEVLLGNPVETTRIIGGDNVTIIGDGSESNPYILSVEDSHEGYNETGTVSDFNLKVELGTPSGVTSSIYLDTEDGYTYLNSSAGNIYLDEGSQSTFPYASTFDLRDNLFNSISRFDVISPSISLGDVNGENNNTFINIDDTNQRVRIVSPTVSLPSTTIANINTTGIKAVITKEYADLNYAGGAAAFEVLDEGNGDGIVVSGRTAANYGNIGRDARDLSSSNSTSTVKGATGNYSFAAGQNVEASGIWSFAGGLNSIADGAEAFAFGADVTATGAGSVALGRLNNSTQQYTFTAGFQNNATATYATALGFRNESSGDASFSFGTDLFAKSLGEFSIGINGTDYIPNSTINFDATDRIFNIGNGVNTSNRSNAFTIYKNGAAVLHPITLASVTNEQAGMMIIDSADSNQLKFYDGTAWRTVSFT